MTGHAPSAPNQELPVRAAGEPASVVLDVSELRHPDLAAIEALCRIALEVRRCGDRVCLPDAPPELLELIELTGLGRVLGSGAGEPEPPPGGS